MIYEAKIILISQIRKKVNVFSRNLFKKKQYHLVYFGYFWRD